MAEKCSKGHYENGKWIWRCPEPAVPDRIYCEDHLAEALARVAQVNGSAQRPWPGITRGSYLGRPYAKVVHDA
jgi:hypothetical protein